jgi:N-glycosylase/DNA lyase
MLITLNIEITKEDILQAKEACKKFQIKKSDGDIFYEMCFSLCSPGVKFNTNKKVNDLLREKNLYSLSRRYSIEDISEFLKSIRYGKRKAGYIFNAILMFDNGFGSILSVINNNVDDVIKREFLIKNIRGFGYKTSSQFLRNSIGCTDLSLLDTHVQKYLNREVNNSNYISIENDFREKANVLGLTVVELDAIIFSRGAEIDIRDIR